MHAKSIIFRDLKLENVLLDEDGHCRLSDLGLVAVYGKKKVSHYAGTPGYIAPEVAQKQAYGPSADFFSLGVTLYRMLSARKPFRGNTRADFDRAVCTEEPPYDPNVFSPTAISLLKGLLAKDPAKRLGARGTQEIKDHPFFASIDWGLLEVGYLDPPFVPSRHDVNANSIEDITRDDDAKEYERIYLDEKFHKQTADFDYVSPDALRREIVAALRKEMELERTRNLDVAGKPNKCCVIL
jgi:serine/threonine protein kinase